MKRISYILPMIISVLLMMIIFYFSAQPANESTEMSDPFAYFIVRCIFEESDKDLTIDMIANSEYDEIFQSFRFIVRKFAHFYIYFLLGNHMYLSLKNLNIRFCPAISGAVCLIYAVSDEIHQYFIPGRSCEFRDVMIDFCGSFIPIMIIFLIDYKEKRNDRNKCIKNI